MSNWDLMMPGMGLTAIGLAGVVISYAEIAHTFIDGMHALTGLTMFVGLIFLATGILDGGVSTSNRAKATVLVIASISLGFGMYAFTMNTSAYTVTIAGILMAIAFPSIIIAYLAMKHQQYLKPVGSIVGMASAAGIIAWIAFGFVSPDQYMIPQEVAVEEPEEIAPAGPVYTIRMLEGSDVQGAPDYDPDEAGVQQGHVVEWINEDIVEHTATSFEDVGETFDSGLVGPGESFTLDTTDLEAGEYEYFCIVHPWMSSTLTVEAAKEPTTVVMPDGASIPGEGQIYYDPETVTISAGDAVLWDNADSMAHTVTSGTPDSGPTEMFDSGMFAAGESFEFTFTESGTFDYYCIVHPWMTGTVVVE